MHKAKKCSRCGVITRHDQCTCGSITKTVTGHRLASKLSIDVTLTLRFDQDRQPFLLVQKPSGQARIPLDQHDLLHT